MLRRCGWVGVVFLGLAVSAPAQNQVRTFDLAYSATIPARAGAGTLRVWMPLPHSGPFQEIQNLQVQSPVPHRLTRESTYGNSMAYLEVADPSGPLTLGFRCRVTRREHKNAGLKLTDAEREMIERFLVDDGKGVVHHPKVASTLDRLIAGRPDARVEVPRAVYDYVVATMKYDKETPGWGQGDTLRACDVAKGNCTDFHALFISLCRKAGIPAKFAMGLPLPAQRGEGEIPGYHCWAYFLTKGSGWTPVDASEAAKNPTLKEFYFGGLTADRVEMTQGRELVLEPRQKGPALNYFVFPYAEQGDRPVEKVARRMTYKDATSSD